MVRITSGTGLLNSGTRIVLRTGIRPPDSVSSVPFWNVRMAFSQASEVLYMKLPSIHAVIWLTCSRGAFGLWPVFRSYAAR